MTILRAEIQVGSRLQNMMSHNRYTEDRQSFSHYLDFKAIILNEFFFVFGKF